MAALLLAVLAGCVSLPRQTDSAGTEAVRGRYLAEHTDWAFSGRMAYSHMGKGGSAQIEWRQRGPDSEVRISGPLATGSVQLRFNAEQAQLLDAAGQVLKTGKPDELMAELLQAPVPVAGLTGGLRAFWPDSPDWTASAAAGPVAVSGWLWHYGSWHDEPVRLPGRIEVSRGQTRLRIVIDQWREVPGG